MDIQTMKEVRTVAPVSPSKAIPLEGKPMPKVEAKVAEKAPEPVETPTS